MDGAMGATRGKLVLFSGPPVVKINQEDFKIRNLWKRYRYFPCFHTGCSFIQCTRYGCMDE